MDYARIRIIRAGPLTTIQDAGRPGWLAHGIGASGPMDRGSFDRAGFWLGASGRAGIEFSRNGLSLEIDHGRIVVAGDGGHFGVAINGRRKKWPFRAALKRDDFLEITPGSAGNYGYLRFSGDFELPEVLDSYATNTIAGFGGVEGRSLRPADELTIINPRLRVESRNLSAMPAETGPIRITWGLHADMIPDFVRQGFIERPFLISDKLDRMGVRLDDPTGLFRDFLLRSLISDPVLPGDLQILGDGTPVVLMVDHQPTGGYPRVGTIIGADFDRFAQLRPGTEVRFEPVSVERAQTIRRSIIV